MKLKMAKNWYKSFTAMVGGAMVILPSIAEQLVDLQPLLGENGVLTLAFFGALVLAARAIKQESISGKE